MKRTALILLHPGFEEMEAITPIDILRRGGVEVLVASLGPERLVEGRNGIRVEADCLLEAVPVQSFDALILPGGPGINDWVRQDARVIPLLRQQVEAGRWLAAICAAPLVLKDAGLLEGRPYTSHFSTADELPDRDPDAPVVESGRIITSQGAGTALDFALVILEALVDESTANAVAESIGCELES